MNERELREALRRAVSEDDAARERSWRVVRAAYGDYEPRPRRRRWAALLVALALTPLAAGAAVAAGAPHSDVGRWVRGVLGVGERDARPVLGHVPGGGRLLVEAGGNAWVVAADGAKRRIGAYAGTSWSPRGLFVAGWRGRELTALDGGGGVRWSLGAPALVTVARWGPVDGYRVAYVAGSALRIVNGNGTADRRLATTRPGVAPEWRPDDGHVLAYVDGAGRVDVVAVDAGRRLWRSERLAQPGALAWSSDGRQLLVVTRRRLVLLGSRGRRLTSRAIAPGFAVTGAQWRPRGSEIAVVRHDAATRRSELALVDADRGLRERVLFTGPGRFGAAAWSPGATRLLLPWPDADQWLFLRPGFRSRLTAVANIAAQFAPGARGAAAFPRSVQWCCDAPAP
ncbi:MAG: hypothetical protein QOE31_2033 [Solirubrobacteraceae bacterium]|nr:hypothetical protein [Solirubrobacteraceae bacterium]